MSAAGVAAVHVYPRRVATFASVCDELDAHVAKVSDKLAGK